MDRRGFLASLSVAALGANAPAPRRAWSRGGLEIHHISTGRGNATLCIFPDATTLLIDAGAVRGNAALMVPPRPDATRRPGEWIARYVQRRLAETKTSALDVALLTHFHPDHMGDAAGAPPSRIGPYRLTGITDVAELVPIRRIVDRAYPAYDYPAPLRGETMDNYRLFIAAGEARGMRAERFRAGSTEQFRLEHGVTAAAAPFAVRNLAANGDVWTGAVDGVESRFPAPSTLRAADLPDENACSCAVRIAYGPFAYFAGGDLTFTTADGDLPWRDIESVSARACGHVDVAAVDHHGYYDGGGAEFVRALRPRIFVLQAWHATHPALSTLDRLYSTRLYPGERDVFATAVHPAAAAVDERLIGRLRSTAGHVVVRVAPGGRTYTIDVVDDRDESDRVLATFGPYAADSGV